MKKRSAGWQVGWDNTGGTTRACLPLPALCCSESLPPALRAKVFYNYIVPCAQILFGTSACLTVLVVAWVWTRVIARTQRFSDTFLHRVRIALGAVGERSRLWFSSTRFLRGYLPALIITPAPENPLCSGVLLPVDPAHVGRALRHQPARRGHVRCHPTGLGHLRRCGGGRAACVLF